MPVTLASRAEIVKKMDQQFNDDLKMRQDTTTVGKDLLQNNALLFQNRPVPHLEFVADRLELYFEHR